MVSLDFPHPKENSVVKSPTLLLRAYLIHDGSADELKTRAVSHMQSGIVGLSTARQTHHFKIDVYMLEHVSSSRPGH